MAESLGSDLESDASSADGCPTSMAWSQTTTTAREQLSKRVDSLQQENRVLKMELDTFRYKCKSLEEENRELKKARVTIVSDNGFSHRAAKFQALQSGRFSVFFPVLSLCMFPPFPMPCLHPFFFRPYPEGCW